MISIVRTKPEFADTLTQITISAKRHWKYPEKWIQLWLPQLTITAEYVSENEVWAASDEGRIVGYYALRQVNRDCWLDNLWVLPGFMDRGIGRSLFEHALGRCRELDGSILKIEADPNAQGFYEHMGARKVGEHHTSVENQPRILPLMEIQV